MKKERKNLIKRIISRKRATNAVILITKYIRDRNLTDAIGLLQKHGFSADAARLIVGYVQCGSEVKHELK